MSAYDFAPKQNHMEPEKTKSLFGIDTIVAIIVLILSLVFIDYKAKTIGAENPAERTGNVTTSK